MKINGRVARTQSDSRFINGTLFCNDDYAAATVNNGWRTPADANQMRSAAIRFAAKNELIEGKIYSGWKEGNRWVFKPHPHPNNTHYKMYLARRREQAGQYVADNALYMGDDRYYVRYNGKGYISSDTHELANNVAEDWVE